MTCTCGHVTRLEAANEDEAIAKMKDAMDKKAIKEHWREMHPGNIAPSVEEVHQMIEQELMFSPATA